MIVGVCGYGFSGSGAVIDLLSTYNTVTVASESELSIIYKPDGIDDLKRALVDNPVRYYSSDTAIRRFMRYMKRSAKEFDQRTEGAFSLICNEYIESLIQVRWQGSTMAHYYQDNGMEYILRQRLLRGLRRRFEKYFGPICRPFPPDKEMYYSVMDEQEFMTLSRAFLMRIINAMLQNKEKNSHIVVDQLFSADNPERDLDYFEDVKAIVVSRDPRDLYILSKTRTGMDGRFIPYDSVYAYVQYYKGLMKGNKAEENKRVHSIHFEDLIYKAQETRTKIEDFLDLKGSRYTEGAFSPEKSINNTQLFLKFPQFKEDIRIIEGELSLYLYNFSEYGIVPTFNSSTF